MPRGMHPNSLANLQKGKATQFGANGDSTAKKAGEKSAETRAERKTMREAFLLLLSEPITKDGKPTGKNTQDAMIAGVMKRAVAGDVRAAEFIRDTIGEKPVQKVANVTPAPDVVDNVERALFGDDAG